MYRGDIKNINAFYFFSYFLLGTLVCYGLWLGYLVIVEFCALNIYNISELKLDLGVKLLEIMNIILL